MISGVMLGAVPLCLLLLVQDRDRSASLLPGALGSVWSCSVFTALSSLRVAQEMWWYRSST